MDMKKKLSSRKLWAAVAGLIAGLTMVFGLDADVINVVAGAVTSAASVVTYILAECSVDKAAVAKSAGEKSKTEPVEK